MDPSPLTKSVQEEREAMRRRAEHLAASWTGAAEALDEELDDLRQDFEEAIHELGEITRASVEEVQEQAATPEGQRLQEGGRRFRHKIAVQGDEVVHTMEELEESVETRLERMRHAAERRYKEARQKTQQVAQATAESGRRAGKAPSKIGHDLRQAFSAWRQGVMASWGLYAVAAALGVTTLAVFTVGIVGAANVWLGAPWGTLLVSLGYAVAAAASVAGARGAKESGQKKAKEHVHEAREDAEHVIEPLRGLRQTGSKTSEVRT